jgi:hypothetical protein
MTASLREFTNQVACVGPYSIEIIIRKIKLGDLLLILDNLKKGNRAQIPYNNPAEGIINLNFICLTSPGANATNAKFTNDDRRKFIKLANALLQSNMINTITYTSSLMNSDQSEAIWPPSIGVNKEITFWNLYR